MSASASLKCCVVVGKSPKKFGEENFKRIVTSEVESDAEVGNQTLSAEVACSKIARIMLWEPRLVESSEREACRAVRSSIVGRSNEHEQ